MSSSDQTTDHEKIKQWVESRDGRPAVVRAGASSELLRIDFGEPEDGLKPIAWDEFFEIFERHQLSFLYQDRTADGSVSRFNKFVER